MGSGVAFPPTPPDPKKTYSINLIWILDRTPAGTVAVWTYGEGTSAHRVGPVKGPETYFAVEPLHKYTNTSVMRNYGAYWFGATPYAREGAREELSDCPGRHGGILPRR